jgi:hypothetical protein
MEAEECHRHWHSMRRLNASLLAHSEFWECRNGNVADIPFSREDRLPLVLSALRQTLAPTHAKQDEFLGIEMRI